MFDSILIMRNKITRREFAAAMLLTPLGSSLLRGQQIDAGINVGMKAVKIAVPEFKPSTADAKINQLAKVFNDTLWADLDFSGNLDLASRSYYPLGNFANPVDIHPDDWTKTGVDAAYITYGSVAIPTSGSMRGAFTADLHFTELKSNQSPLQPVRWSGGLDTDEAARFVAHNWANAILESLGFGKGVATTKIAYVSERNGAKEVYVMDYDGYGAFPLTSVRDLALTPAWSPDGEHIAYMGYRGTVTNIEVISRNGGSAMPFPSPAGLNTTPAWSPDGKRIAFASNRDRHATDGTEIYLANANGGNMTRLLPRSSTGGVIDTSPVWNPKTGREIAFVSDRSRSQQIYRINDDGTNLRRLIEDGGDAENPSWHPDGNFLAFAWKKPGKGFDIYIHDLVTRRNSQLTQNSGDNEKPTWSPDGKHIAFQSDRNGKLQIYSMLADGTKVRPLTSTGENKAPAWSGYIK
jgi:TolB protein